MNKCKGYSKMWFMVLLLVAFMAGCADNAKEIGIAADATAPTVSVTSPTNTAVDVPINRKVTVGFSEAMDPLTITTATFTLKQGTTSVSGTVTPAGTSAIFTPASNLTVSTVYTATITIGAKDLAGNALASNFSFTFTTGAAADATPPTVSVTSPTNGSTAVALNRKVNVAFSEAMDPLTITTATFTLQQGTTPVSGMVTPAGISATFTPASNLAASTLYTATITTGAKDLAGNALASNFSFTFTTGAAADATPPTVSVTSPTNGSTAVALNRKVNVAFSEAMDPLTMTAVTFKVTAPGGTPVAGAVSYIGTTATFTPSSNFVANTIFTGTITTGAKDLAGNALAMDYIWTFTTGLTADTTVPTVISTIPLNLATGVATNSDVTATFSESMDPLTITTATFTMKETVSGNNVPGTVVYADGSKTATFNPLSDLAFSINYTATIKGGIGGVKDLAGNALAADKIWSFTTGAAPDTAAPTVTITNPADLAIGVAINSAVNATFNEAMDPLTMITANFTVKETASGNNVSGTVSYDVQNNIATFAPLVNLTADTDYTVTVTNGAKDLAGNALVVPAVGGLPKPNPWTFRTAPAAVPPVPLAINLRGAASFGIASRAGLTSTGVTVVNGDVALYPLATCTDSTGNAGASQTCLVKTYSSPTGMTVNGSIYFAGDPYDNGGTANSVTNDLQIAWNEGKNKVDTQGAIAADELGGKIFIPGVYHNAALGLAAGGVATIDAQNDANAIFIFKVDSSFVDSGTLLLPSRIDLVNGAQARNVWFVTGLDITIGSGTTWNGNILAGRTATVLDGSTVNGRVLGGASGAGAITLTGAASPSVTTISVPE